MPRIRRPVTHKARFKPVVRALRSDGTAFGVSVRMGSLRGPGAVGVGLWASPPWSTTGVLATASFSAGPSMGTM